MVECVSKYWHDHELELRHQDDGTTEWQDSNIFIFLLFRWQTIELLKTTAGVRMLAVLQYQTECLSGQSPTGYVWAIICQLASHIQDKHLSNGVGAGVRTGWKKEKNWTLVCGAFCDGCCLSNIAPLCKLLFVCIALCTRIEHGAFNEIICTGIEYKITHYPVSYIYRWLNRRRWRRRRRRWWQRHRLHSVQSCLNNVRSTYCR